MITPEYQAKIHDVWNNQRDTRRAFLELTEDQDIRDFMIRELGHRDDYFTDAQENSLYEYLHRAMKNFIITDRIILERVDYTILTLRLLLSLKEDIDLFKDLKRWTPSNWTDMYLKTDNPYTQDSDEDD